MSEISAMEPMPPPDPGGLLLDGLRASDPIRPPSPPGPRPTEPPQPRRRRKRERRPPPEPPPEAEDGEETPDPGEPPRTGTRVDVRVAGRS